MKRRRDDEIGSDTENDEEYINSDNDNEDEYETTHEAQVRMKKQMIKKLKADLQSRNVENVEEEVRKILEEEALNIHGKILKDISHQCIIPNSFKVKLYKNKYDITCLTYSTDGKYIFTGSKGGDVAKWDVFTASLLAQVKGGRRFSKHKYHCSRITSIACNDEFVATADLEKKIFIWDIDLSHKKTLQKHRKEITSLVFRRNSQQLFSGDKKGIIFVWDMTLMNTIEELLGHTSEITGLDSNLANNCVSCSGIGDACVKMWKLDKETMVAFSLPKKEEELSLECISMLNDQYFVAGSATNKIYLWDGISKKTPIDVVDKAHDFPVARDLITTNEIMVVSLCALRNSKLFASGSNMGQVKLWALIDNGSNLVISFLSCLPNIFGCVNDLKFSPHGKDLAVVISDQHKRWRMQKRCPGVKSCVMIFNLFK